MQIDLRQVILPVTDLRAGLAFYEDALGLSVAMRDGNRYATIDAGPIKLALAAPEERRIESGPAVAFKGGSLDAVVARLTARGIAAGMESIGAHQRSIEIRDPGGNAVIFYESL